MISLNLLPPEIKSEIYYAKKNTRLSKSFRLTVLLTVSLLAFFGLLFFIIRNENNLATERKELAANRVVENQGTEEESIDLANRLLKIKKLKSEQTDWNEILSVLSQSTPPGLRIQTLTLNKDIKSKGKITGIARSDRDIALFKELLAENEIFKYVDVESITGANSATSSEQRKTFVISLYLKVGSK